MDPNTQPPPGQATPPPGYAAGPPPPGYSAAPPPPPPRQGGGGGLGQYISANVQASPVERFSIMLLRLIAWIALIILVIALCADFFNVVTNLPRGEEFRGLLNGFASMLRNFAVGAVTAATLLALASIVESLIVMRRNRT